MTDAFVTPWTRSELPTEDTLRRLFSDEGLSPYMWSNAPLDVYDAHAHDYNKVIYVLQGSITFCLCGQDRELTLSAGDRLDLPAGTLHDATVGTQGVICFEAHH
ncbi:MAG TPA: cupin domain-containing protein [Anaerolineales bacterium]|nr:cupin domain-containing protein [Anaerolineales bacterium]